MSKLVVNGCELCPVKVKKTGDARWNTRIDIINGEGNDKAPTIMIVLDGPFKEDSSTGQLLIDGPSSQLERLLEMAGIPEEEVFVTVATRCFAPWVPIRKELEACKPHLVQDIEGTLPRVIMPMGTGALWSVLGKERITDQRGSMFETEWGIPCVPTFSPASIYHSAGNEKAIVNDLQKAYRLANGDELTAMGDYKICDTLDAVVEAYNEIMSVDVYSFDFETTSLNPRVCNNECECCNKNLILCASFSIAKGTGYTIPLWGQYCEPIWEEEDRLLVEQILVDIFSNDAYKIAANGKFDIEWAHYYLGVDMSYGFDAQYGFAMVNEERPHSLEHQRTLYTNMPRYEAFKDDPEIKKAIKLHGYAGIPNENLWFYAAADADLTFRAYEANIVRMYNDSYKAGGAFSHKYQNRKITNGF